MLDRTDRDGSELLDMQEFRRAIRNVGQLTAADLSDSDVRCLFRKIDRDNSGAIDLATGAATGGRCCGGASAVAALV